MNQLDINKTIKYIRDNIENDITLDDIADYMNYSKFHLSRTFKKKTGASLKQYIEALKVEKGISEIIESDQSVTDIALNTGHKSLTTFSRTFKKQTKLSPKKYKKQATFTYNFLISWMKKKSYLVHHDHFTKTDNSFSLSISYPDGYKPKITCAGLFPEAMPKGEPVVGVATADILEFTIDNIPNGTYYLFMCEIMEDFSLSNSYVLNQNYRACAGLPFSFSDNSHYSRHMQMRRPMLGDPPININLPELIVRTFSKKTQLILKKVFY